MTTTVALTLLLIVVARITDMTLDTIRTAAIVQGRRVFAGTLGFFQALIYVSVIAQVLTNTDKPVYALAYAVGFALGTFLGIVIEQRLAFGHQVAWLFTRKGPEVAKGLAAAGYRVAGVHGESRAGDPHDVTILYVSIPRKHAPRLIRDAVAIDESCFAVVNDVRQAGYLARAAANPEPIRIVVPYPKPIPARPPHPPIAAAAITT
jgi:uncharacterized protein YebE (UPF0316 family)